MATNPDPQPLGASSDSATLARRFAGIRQRTDALAAPISAEDAQIQSMADVSPTKWHLAHSSWFFETFLLRDYLPDYRRFDANFHYLFNSYYEAEGPRLARDRRGMISRPSLARVLEYRQAVGERLLAALDPWSARDDWPRIAALLELGCQHEQQHQELMLTDIKHVLHENPLAPAYHQAPLPGSEQAAPLTWQAFDEGIHLIGHRGQGFAYDNESPRHKRLVAAFALASRTVTCGEFLAFIEDGGYDRPSLWLSDGDAWRRKNRIDAPLYWHRTKDGWSVFTLSGLMPLDADEPVAHLSLYEADAFASWAGARLPREEELEIAAISDPEPRRINDAASDRFHPRPSGPPEAGARFSALAGDVWEWTASAYAGYPGFRPEPGAVGEYNGKFMCDQYVLRGGSCATPQKHWRPTYRNFFPAAARWQFTGLRLAKDL